MGRGVATAVATPPERAAAGDPFGFAPLFSWPTSAGLVVRPSLASLLECGAPSTLDFDALSVFLRLGFFVGSDTPFAAIEAVPPRRQPYSGPPLTLSRSQAVDAFIETFRAVVRRRLPTGPYQIPLSGDCDSRHILCELVDAGCPPEACVTVEHFPPRGNSHLAIAAALAGRLGVRHVVLAQRAERIHVEREKNRRTHFCTDEHAELVVLADYLASATRVTYDGIAGDVLSQSTYLNPAVQRLFESRNADAIARYLLDGYGNTISERALAQLLSRNLLREVPRERAIARVRREIKRHTETPNPVASFFFWNRTRREIALSPFALMRDIEVRTPYLDEELYTLLSAMPASMQMDRQFHTQAIRRAYPGIADIPYESKSDPQRAPGFHRLVALELARLCTYGPRTLLSARVLPSVAATVVDGSAVRMWYAPLVVYLVQLAALIARDR